MQFRAFVLFMAALAVVPIFAPAGLIPTALIPTALAQTAPDPTAPGLSDGERLDVLLARVQHEQQAMKALSARFTMLQESEMLLEPEKSTGDFFYLAPDRARWDYENPNPITVVVRKGEMLTWYRDLQRAERAKVGRYSDRILQYMSASSSLENLLEYFDARVSFQQLGEVPYRIVLTPNVDRIARRLSSMTLWIDPQLYLPRKVRIEAADGDVTEFEFEDLVVNPALEASRFQVELPAEVEVTTVDLSQGTR